MAKFAPAIPLVDMPFLFRELGYWNADFKIIGYAGGGVRNLVSSAPIANLAGLAGHRMRVMGAPLQAQTFSALTAAPSAIAYNAIQSGLIAGL
jgi:TRAP-type C4-dicarboxylate transport system substrate-binding protein